MKKLIFLIIPALIATQLFAQNWTGAVSSDWNNSANWSTVPANGDDVLIDPANYTGAMMQPVVSGTSNFTPAGLLIQNGAHLLISGNLNTSDAVEVLGAGTLVTITGGTFSLIGGGNNGRLIVAEDAHLQMEGGSLNCAQRLLFELGGSGEVNAGTVVVGETIALIDGSITASSKLVQNGGMITTNAEFGFENEAGLYFPVFEQTDGELHINGSLLWLGVTPGSGRGYFRSTGGTVFVTGTIVNDPASTMGMHIELSGTALMENSGSAVQSLIGDSIVVRNGAQWTDVNTTAWQNNGIVYASDGSLFQSGNTTLNGTGAYQFDHVTIPAAKLLNHLNPAVMSVSGNLLVTGGFNQNSNRLVLNGSVQQSITAPAGLVIYDLEVNNSAGGIADGGYGITLNNNLTINHDLQLTDGIIESAPLATIALSDNATVTGGADTSFVDGYMEKIGDDALWFPVGDSPDRYRPLFVSAPATVSTVIRLAYRFDPYTTLTPVETPLQSVSNIEYWDLSRTGSADLVTAEIGWNNAAQSGLTDCADISMTVWDGAQWAFVASTTSGLCNGNNAGTVSSTMDLPVMGPITIGFTENVYQNQVEVCAGESVVVDTNNYTESGVYIDVLQAANGDDSTIVTILTVFDLPVITVTDNVTHLVASAPNATAYQWIDCNDSNALIPGATTADFYPVANGSYAVIVSANACSDTSECMLISELGLSANTYSDFQLFPNPVSGNGILKITLDSMTDLHISTLDGRIIEPESIRFTGGITELQLKELAPGTYLLLGHTIHGEIIQKRFLVANN